MDKKRPVFITIMCILLLVITVGLFSTWGYQWVNYLLAKSFNVETQSSIYDLFIGLIAMISSVIVFIGVISVWQMKSSALKLMLYGSIGFLIKNVLDIINDVNPLLKLAEISSSDITDASWAIGSDLFQMAFWIFIIILFSRQSFKEQLS